MHPLIKDPYNPEDPDYAAHSLKALKGFSKLSWDQYQANDRDGLVVDSYYDTVGFRPVRTVKEEE